MKKSETLGNHDNGKDVGRKMIEVRPINSSSQLEYGIKIFANICNGHLGILNSTERIRMVYSTELCPTPAP